MKLPDLLAGKKHVATLSTEEPNNPEGLNVLDKDVAFALVGEHAQAIDPVVEARVVRKVDLFLIPAMIIGMLFVFFNESSVLYRIDICEYTQDWEFGHNQSAVCRCGKFGHTNCSAPNPRRRS